MLGSDLTHSSASALALAIQRGEVTSRDVVAAHLAKIARVNSGVCAIVELSASALAEADQADDIRRRGLPMGRLHGVPITVKDWLEVAGLACAASTEQRVGFVPAIDATAVKRMKEAGAIVLGKTKPGETDEVHPRPRNPFDLARTAGTSSGGEAAIVASRASPLGIGSDSGGSIRWPAHCCGVYGLKPTAGLVPLTGHFPVVTPTSDPRTVVGPLARSVDDLELALHVMAGPDHRDASTVPVPLGDSKTVTLNALRIAWFEEFPGAVANEAAKAAVHRVLAILSPLTKELRQSCPGRIDEARGITEAYWARPESMSSRQWRPPRASSLTADRIEESLFEWDRLRRSMTTFFADIDVLICPTAGRGAAATTAIDDFAYTLPFSLTGNPVVSVPVSCDSDGMPVGVQVIARCFADHVALAVARVLESQLVALVPTFQRRGV